MAKTATTKYNKIVIGIDQSYTDTGLTIAADGKPIKITSINFKGLKSRSSKRNHLRAILTRLIPKCKSKALSVSVICERISTFRKSFGAKAGNTDGLNPNYLKMTGALVAVIVDVAAQFDIEVFSVDTRAWKSKIVGSSKAKNINGKRDAKGATVDFVIKNFNVDLLVRVNKKGEKIYNDNAADSCCIALYGFLPKSKQNLKLEE